MANNETSATAAAGAKRLIQNYNQPDQDDNSRTCFSELRWGMTLAYKDGDSVVLFHTANERHWAAVTAEAEGNRMRCIGYAAVAKNAPTALMHQMPEHSTAWRRQNILNVPHVEQENYAAAIHVAASLAILSRRGDIGREGPPLQPVRTVRRLPRRNDNSSTTTYEPLDGSDRGLAVVTTSHLRYDTTSIEAFIVANAEQAEAGTDIDQPLPYDPLNYIDMSMFGRHTPSTEQQLGRLFASMTYAMEEGLPIGLPAAA
ncbi:MAG TPA: hypothetical protein VGO07_01855 [Candidatus Saccharimonadales bacterium]|jgi:hypothetical protein|nr:hypothetical protein [Candidatus Saccharimonadales bacterium]